MKRAVHREITRTPRRWVCAIAEARNSGVPRQGGSGVRGLQTKQYPAPQLVSRRALNAGRKYASMVDKEDVVQELTPQASRKGHGIQLRGTNQVFLARGRPLLNKRTGKYASKIPRLPHRIKLVIDDASHSASECVTIRLTCPISEDVHNVIALAGIDGSRHPASKTVLPMDRIWAGSFLVCIWSSLRFSDAQHVRWSSVNAASDASVLRGISYRTKTGTRGTPFALGGCGLSASKGAVAWISAWLHGLQQVWDCLRVTDAAVDPDCLFFRCDLAARTFEPLSYTQCLRVFRTYLADWLGTHDSDKYSSHFLVSPDAAVDALVSTYSLHSCKATVLSWLARPDVRLAQGHRSNPLLQSMTLYSRDSVFPALQAQSRLMSLLQLDFESLHASEGSGRLRTVSGWSPVAPQHRGSQLLPRQPGNQQRLLLIHSRQTLFLLPARTLFCHGHLPCRSPMRFCFCARGRCLA